MCLSAPKISDMLMISGRVLGKVPITCNGVDSLRLRGSMEWRLSYLKAELVRKVRMEVNPLTVTFSDSASTPTPKRPSADVAPLRKTAYPKRKELHTTTTEGYTDSGLITYPAPDTHEEPRGQFVKSLADAYPKLPCRICAGMCVSHYCRLTGLRVSDTGGSALLSLFRSFGSSLQALQCQWSFTTGWLPPA